jgi:hypothetical protein
MIAWLRRWYEWWHTPPETFLTAQWLHQWRQQDRDHPSG